MGHKINPTACQNMELIFKIIDEHEKNTSSRRIWY